MTDIDWSKAPEGATHYFAPCEGFVRIVEGIVHYWEREWRENGCKQGDYAEGFLIARPATCDGNHSGPRCADPGCWNDDVPAWSGQGLPPVLAVCEACYTSPDEYYQAKVLVHDDGKAVYRWLAGPCVGDISESDNRIFANITGPHPKFRPIRTTEQIAAEEREKAIEAMCDHFMRDSVEPIPVIDACSRLYDAGYRKVEGGAP